MLPEHIRQQTIKLNMKNIMDKFKNKKLFNNSIGLTLAEVLISVVLTTLLMLYGTSFFIASWRLSSESNEYSTVLDDLVANLECYKAKAFDTPVSISTDYVVKNKTFRNKYSVSYTLSRNGKSGNEKFVDAGITYYYVVTSSTTLNYGKDADGKELSAPNEIQIKTAVAKKWPKL